MEHTMSFLLFYGAAVVVILLWQYRMLMLCQLARWRLRRLIAKQAKEEKDEESDSEDGSDSEEESHGDNEEEEITVSSLCIYPLKSARGIALQKVKLDELGLKDDRRLCVVRGASRDKPQPRFITQRQAPHLVTVSAAFHEDEPKVTLSSPLSKSSVTVNVSDQALHGAKRIKVGIWEDQVTVADLGNEAATFTKSVLSVDEHDRGVSFGDARLVSILPNEVHNRPSNPDGMPFAAYHHGSIPQVGMADAYPLLICTETSLGALNQRLAKKNQAPIPMNRFRPNLVVKGSKAFEEDKWKVIQVGPDTILHVVSSCPRCKMSCIDQDTGKMFLEPLETLSEFRENGNEDEAYFGVYAVAQDSLPHTIHVNDPVKVLLKGDPEYDE